MTVPDDLARQRARKCTTCNGWNPVSGVRRRETRGLVCPTCGWDYGKDGEPSELLDVPPDLPAVVDRDEVARVLIPLQNEAGQVSTRQALDALLSSGVLVAAADVRARALEDAAKDARRSVGAEDGLTLTHAEVADWLELRAYMARTDRAVSEREGGGGDE